MRGECSVQGGLIESKLCGVCGDIAISNTGKRLSHVIELSRGSLRSLLYPCLYVPVTGGGLPELRHSCLNVIQCVLNACLIV